MLLCFTIASQRPALSTLVKPISVDGDLDMGSLMHWPQAATSATGIAYGVVLRYP